MPKNRFRRSKSGSNPSSPTFGGSNVQSSSADTDFASHPSGFVTQPPKPAKGLTGKISTLFRRESSREHSSSPYDDDFDYQSHKAYLASSGARQSVSPENGPQMMATISAGRQSARGKHSGDNGSDNKSRKSNQKRIFYSSHQDDDSDDSYETGVSRSSRPVGSGADRALSGSSSNPRRQQQHARSAVSYHTESQDTTANHTEDQYSRGYESDYTDGTNVKLIKRYRGFSTSIKSLFLDESLVCGAVGCFGLILSNRTEYLLQLRNERRGALSPRGSSSSDRKKMPSRIIAIALLTTLVLMFSTFLIWGFGTGNGVVGDYLNGYDYYEDNDGSNTNNANDGSNNMNYNNNNDGGNDNGEDEEGDDHWWDDYLTNNDDDGNGNGNGGNAYNNDDAAQNNAYNNNNGDDAVANDDQQQQQNNDDAAANEEQNQDDAVADDQVSQNDDGDDYYSERRTRFLDSDGELIPLRHPLHGIFKIRDSQENLWQPIADIVRNEWYRDGNGSENASPTLSDRRRSEETTNDDDSYMTDEDNVASYNVYRQRRDIAADIRVALLFTFLIFLGFLGRRRRMRTRFYLVRARAQEDHLYYASSDEAASRRVAFDDTREDQYEGACSHTLCGCYPSDEVEPTANDENVEVTDTGLFKRKTKPHNEDIVARAFNCFMGSCCGIVCKCWFQCMSICALAQEARELRLLIPPRYQRVDYITHQPFHEYQEAVNDLRRGWLGKARRISGIMPHYHALSRLSRYIIVVSFVLVTLIGATLVFNPRAAFSWQDAVVLIATFVQSFLVLFIVHGIFHKSDLSMDAVVKMFASGFLIAVPTAFFLEGLLVNVVLFSSWLIYDGLEYAVGEAFSMWVYNHWRAIWIVGELFNAYIVAAVTEELCKYYSFRAVEHPDLVFLTGLQRDTQDDAAVDGGLVKYPFGSHQVQKLVKSQSFGDQSTHSERSHRSSRSNRGKHRKREDKLLERTGTTEAEFDEDELDARTRRQRAMAITTGMISVAVGLACAENFIYVFVLGGALGENDPEASHKGDLMEAWIVLFFRSIFPVHALAAAMQSINMIRKFVEVDKDNGHRVGVGRIILPAVILHGSFDAVLMGINVFVETSWDRYLEQNDGNIGDEEPYNVVFVNVAAWISITFIMLAGMFWYFRENRKQSTRLKVLEEQDKALIQAEDWVASSASREESDFI